MRVLPVGDQALLAELDDLDNVLALFEWTTLHRLAGVADIVPAACTLLVRFDPDIVSAHQVEGWLRELVRKAMGPKRDDGIRGLEAPCVGIPVHYVGEDLEEVAQMLGLTCAELVERHTGTDFRAGFAGFAPGFVYLTGGDPSLHGIARLTVPRTRVPASSVAIAGDFSAVYPTDSPGGWRLLGVTPLRMWDLERPSPALVQPGFKVRFRDLAAIQRHYSLPSGSAGAEPGGPPAPGSQAAHEVPHLQVAATAPVGAWLEVLNPGAQTLVQDLGRPGMTSLGVSASGALDRTSVKAANRLVGNPEGAAVLENVWGGLTLVCHGEATLAITGAPVSVVLTTASGMRVPAAAGSRLLVADGQTLRLGRPRAGMRCYVAVQGGWDVAPVLGSCSTDVLAGLGPAPLRKGDRLPVGTIPASEARPVAAQACGSESEPLESCALHDSSPAPGDVVCLRIVLGPRDDWFDPAAQERLVDQAWMVTPQSNRVGLRLSGEHALTRVRSTELPSEGMVAGALEVPPSGQPVLFLADHPLTGGYPVIAVVVDRDLDRLAQVAPGVHLRFVVA